MSGATDRTIDSGASPDGSAWGAGVFGPAELSGALAKLSDLGAAAIMELDPGSERSFVQAVAQAYEAGFALDFSGLFAGEARRRISVPSYPFQRRSFWFKET
ncbi:MAG: hypothetical protein F4057_11125 [Acidobacteria bacterium]|nr:hypothetical protein [Acidobacteriota bacterium]